MKIIRARAIRQKNPATGEINLTLTLDPITPLQEFAVNGGYWGMSTPQSGELVIVGDALLLDELADKEFRSVL